MVYVQNSSRVAGVKYCHSLMPNVAPVYKDVAASPDMPAHPFFKSKPQQRRNLSSLATCPTSATLANELKRGVNPLAGIVPWPLDAGRRSCSVS